MANIARDGAPKRSQADVAVHDGMSRQTATGPLARGGDDGSALDAMSGAKVKVPGQYPPGVADGPALDVPPVAKVHNGMLTDLGRAILDEGLGHAKTYDDFNNRMAAANKQ